MTDTGDYRTIVQTDDGPVQVLISRTALAKLSGRSHVTPEEVASAYKIEIEDIVRDLIQGGARGSTLRISEKDF